MAYSKIDMQEELLEFMQGYANSVERLYGGNVASILSTSDVIQNSYLWKAMSDMYDFGVMGILVPVLGTDLNISGHVDAELFFNCIATKSMDMYFDEDDVIFPKKCIDTVRIAVARLVLEGGERDSDWGVLENGSSNGDYDQLTLSEVALLADMDERSVRNAANPKANNPLQTKSVGKRTLVTASEAKRWLADRKGFTPTQSRCVENTQITNKEISLPEDLVNSLVLKAEQSGLTLIEFIKTVL